MARYPATVTVSWNGPSRPKNTEQSQQLSNSGVVGFGGLLGFFQNDRTFQDSGLVIWSTFCGIFLGLQNPLHHGILP